jgi:hypothetical protein
MEMRTRMTRKRLFTIPLLLGLVLMAGAAHTATLSTPPLVPDGENELDCYLVNVSDKRREATIEVLNRDGAVLKSVDVMLDPGAHAMATALANELPRYCEFTVEGGRPYFRASILVRQPGTGSISALPAE